MDLFALFDFKSSLLGAQFGAGAIGTYTSTNSFDTAGGVTGVTTAGAGQPNAVGPGGVIGGPLMHDLGRGRRLLFYAQIHTAVTSAGAATVQVNFVAADDAALSVNVNVPLQSQAIAKTSLVSGYRFRHGSIPGVIGQRYVGAQVVIGAAALTAGSYTAGLILDQDDHADVLG